MRWKTSTQVAPLYPFFVHKKTTHMRARTHTYIYIKIIYSNNSEKPIKFWLNKSHISIILTSSSILGSYVASTFFSLSPLFLCLAFDSLAYLYAYLDLHIGKFDCVSNLHVQHVSEILFFHLYQLIFIYIQS